MFMPMTFTSPKAGEMTIGRSLDLFGPIAKVEMAERFASILPFAVIIDTPPILVVADAAIGLALAVRGGSPAEGIHWLYGVAIVLALLGPGALRPELSAQTRSGALAVGALLATALAWRLGASG